MDLVVDDPPVYLGGMPVRAERCSPGIRINVCAQVLVARVPHQPVFQLTLQDSLDPEALVAQSVLERFLCGVHAFAADQPSYWHCREGVNRSAFALAAYLHLYRGLRISSAIDRLRTCRSPLVLCNTLFEETLRTWYGDADEQDFSRTRFAEVLKQRSKHTD